MSPGATPKFHVLLGKKKAGMQNFTPPPKKNFYIPFYFNQPGLQSFESTQLNTGWLSQTLHLNKGTGKGR